MNFFNSREHQAHNIPQSQNSRSFSSFFKDLRNQINIILNQSSNTAQEFTLDRFVEDQTLMDKLRRTN